jgi:hypothetical protein
VLHRSAAVLLVLLAFAAPAPAQTKKQARAAYSAGDRVCDNLSLSALVGKSPWLVVGAGGAYQYLTADAAEREKLGVFASPWVWGTMLVLVGLVAFKDTLLSAASYLKMPLNALAEVMHTTGGAFGFVYLGSVAFGGDPNTAAGSETASLGSAVYAAEPTSVASQLGDFALYACMCVVHAAVWVVFNTVEVVILLNPFPFVDTALKAGRTAVIGVITGVAQIHPVLGFVAALPVILVSFGLVPIALRFGVVGYVFTLDALKRLFGFTPRTTGPVKGFASWGLKGVRLYTFGTVGAGAGGLEFAFRRFFVLWTKRVPIPIGVAVSSGILTPSLVTVKPDGGQSTTVRFPPRYGGREAELAQQLGLGEVLDGSLGTTLGAAWRQFKAWLFGKKEVTAA